MCSYTCTKVERCPGVWAGFIQCTIWERVRKMNVIVMLDETVVPILGGVQMTVFTGMLVNDRSSVTRLYWHKWCFIIIIQSRLSTWDFAATPFQSPGELAIVSVFYHSV
jgi:hypothetical protein